MTGQLLGQRDALLAANEQIDRRRRFNEAVLAGVSTGVIGVDDEASIMLINASALELLQLDEVQILNKPLVEVVPELKDCITEALHNNGERLPETQIELTRGGRLRVINVRITSEQSTRREHGFVVTLDDITDLVSAQRNSAWADVARRIAHEIKKTRSRRFSFQPNVSAGATGSGSRKIARSSTSASIRSCGRLAISGRWSTNSPPSRACANRPNPAGT
ncbi:PAS domain-containing protein [Roseibium salinum]|nr:PAS domain-containing protein [Roseibium salinum]